MLEGYMFVDDDMELYINGELYATIVSPGNASFQVLTLSTYLQCQHREYQTPRISVLRI